ncbi:MAG TPA: IS1182 family transposase [Caulobacteraceae bacterium]
MSLQPRPIPPLPDDTARVARAAFRRGNRYLRLADELGPLFADEQFAGLFPARGQPALAPWRLALVTVLQFVEDLSDRQAADAVRARLDWKYLLRLDLPDAGFHSSVLSEFRARLVEGDAEALLFEALLARCRAAGFLRAGGRQRTDSTHVLAAVRTLNRLEFVGETLRHALEVLATAAPDWVRQHVPAAWADRYGRRLEDYRLPQAAAARQALAATIGADGLALLRAIYAEAAPAWLAAVPAVETLRRVWLQHDHAPDDAGAVRWRAEADLPPAALRLSSPHDREARVGAKRETSWLGYKVHLTEVAEPDAPLLITDVQTTVATTTDYEATAAVQAALAERALLPGVHVVDAGYVTADQLVASRQAHQIDLLGPTLGDTHWQAATAGAFDVDAFAIDWAARRVACPQGHASVAWSETHDPYDRAVITVRFDAGACRDCPVRARCTRSARGPRRLTLRPQAQHLALRAARAREATPAFKAQYAARAGVEGTLSQGVRAFGLRQARYLGLAKARLQHLLTAAAMNLVRLDAWLTDQPRAATRPSRLVAALRSPHASMALP